MKNYQYYKNLAIEKAKQYHAEASEQNYSYGELADFYNKFYKLAKRYGLIKEFKENGII